MCRRAARLVEGYTAQVWLEAGSADAAASVAISGNESFKPIPDVTGRVTAVADDGHKITVEIAAIPAKGKKGEQVAPGTEARSVEVTIPDDAIVTFTAVGPGEARVAQGYQAAVFLIEDSKDAAASVQFTGENEVAGGKKGFMGKQPTQQGRVVAVDGKMLTIELPNKTKDKMAPPDRMDVSLADETRIGFQNVGRDGAKPTVGYDVMVWQDEGKRTPSMVRFMAPATKSGPDISGPVRDVSADGKVITMLRPGKQKGEAPTEVAITIDAKTKIVYNNVPLDGAKPVPGLEAQVWLQDGSPEAARRIMFGRGK